MQSFTFSLQVLLIKEALCKKDFSPVLINQINKNKTFCQAICCCSYPSTSLKKKKKTTFSCSFSYPFIKKNKTKELEKDRGEKSNNCLNKSVQHFQGLVTCGNVNSVFFPPFLSLNQYNLWFWSLQYVSACWGHLLLLIKPQTIMKNKQENDKFIKVVRIFEEKRNFLR